MSDTFNLQYVGGCPVASNVTAGKTYEVLDISLDKRYYEVVGDDGDTAVVSFECMQTPVCPVVTTFLERKNMNEPKLESESPKMGDKYDNGKPEMQLIPPAAAFEEAAVWTYGRNKYAAFNWYQGMPYSRIISAMERHLTLLKAGQMYDYEHGYHNAASIRCCAAMLIQFTAEGRTELNDLIPMSEENQERMNKLAQGVSIKDLLK